MRVRSTSPQGQHINSPNHHVSHSGYVLQITVRQSQTGLKLTFTMLDISWLNNVQSLGKSGYIWPLCGKDLKMLRGIFTRRCQVISRIYLLEKRLIRHRKRPRYPGISAVLCVHQWIEREIDLLFSCEWLANIERPLKGLHFFFWPVTEADQ